MEMEGNQNKQDPQVCRRTLLRRAERVAARLLAKEQLLSQFRRIAEQDVFDESDGPSDRGGVTDDSGGVTDDSGGITDDSEAHTEPLVIESGGEESVVEAPVEIQLHNVVHDDNNETNEIIFLNDEQKEDYVKNQLQAWGRRGVSKVKIDELLARLRPVFHNLPRSYKTLLGTPRAHDNDITPAAGGLLWYKGIICNLTQILGDDFFEIHGQVKIDINMDGLPLSKSSKIEFWPILGRLHGVETHSRPFAIAVWFGEGKPDNLEEYLSQFLEEYSNLQANGFVHNGVNYNFSIENFILDAPARSFVKCCVGHCGRYSCEKCTVRGEWVSDRMCYTDLKAPLRTDESFKNEEQPEHHRGKSPLEEHGFGMISQFRLDTMHLLWRGAMLRLMTVWLEWHGHFRLGRNQKEEMSRRFETLSTFFPSDFSRLPRGLQYFKQYKATELRRIALYDGILVFQGIVDCNVYKNFLLFHCAVYILSSEELIAQYLDDAETFLHLFVSHSKDVYGAEFVVYGIHALIHLADECRMCGVLENFSAFPYENFLKSVKEVLRSQYKPLHQLANRDAENCWNDEPFKDISSITVCLEHHDAQEEELGQQYRYLRFHGMVFRLGERDSCCLTTQNDVVVVKNIVSRPDGLVIVGCRFRRKSDFYTYPMESSKLGIFSVRSIEPRRSVWSVHDIKSKCVLLPVHGDDCFVAIPLLHTQQM